MWAHLDSSSVLKTASKFIHLKDQDVEAFTVIFKKVFLKKYLDLDLRTSVKMALDLSVDFEGNRSKVVDDFNQLFSVTTQNS
jgi:hypothetical protein